MRIGKVVMFVVLEVLLAVIFIGLWQYRGENVTSPNVWYTDDLMRYPQVNWEPTNAIPLSPEHAVRSARIYLAEKYGDDVWNIDSIELEKVFSERWMYSIRFKRESANEHPSMSIVRVLLSGDVWVPRERVEGADL